MFHTYETQMNMFFQLQWSTNKIWMVSSISPFIRCIQNLDLKISRDCMVLKLDYVLHPLSKNLR